MSADRSSWNLLLWCPVLPSAFSQYSDNLSSAYRQDETGISQPIG